MSLGIELLIAVAVPIAVMTMLRINAAMVFLSLCLGEVLVTYVADDADSLITFLAPHSNSLSATTWRLVILLAPAVLTAVIMIFSVKGKVRAIANIVPAAAASLLATLLVVPLFTLGLRGSIQSQTAWHQLTRAQAMIIVVGAVASLVFLWSQRRAHKKHE